MTISADTRNRAGYGLALLSAGNELCDAIDASTNVTGDVTVTAGVSAIGAAKVTNAMIAPSGLQSAGTLATAAIGYRTGAGGAVTQATNRTTGVTLSKLSGTITTNNASLAAEGAAAFTVTNTLVAIGDVVVVCQQSGANGGNTDVIVTTVAAGSFAITVVNNNASGGTAETGAILINFAVIKAVSA